MSCFDGFTDIEELHSGFEISTRTNQEEFDEFDGFDGELFIGGVKDSVFIPTESIPISKNRLNSTAFYYDENNDRVFYFNKNNWNPNYDAVKNIPSDSYYFLLKLSEDRQEIIKWDGDLETIFRIDTNIEIEEFPLDIFIDDDIIEIGYHTNLKYKTSKNIVRVLPENYIHEPL